MKIKLTSLLIALSIILSLFTVYSFASETVRNTAGGGYTSLRVHYKNSFGDDEDDIGGNRTLNNAVNSTFEEKEESNGNHYGYYNFNDSTKNVFMEFNPSETTNIGPDMLGYMIFEFDFNDFGSAINTSKFLDVNSGKGSFGADGRVAANDILNVGNDSGGNYFYFNKDKTNKIYIKSNEWVHVRCEFSVLSTSATEYQIKCYVGDKSFSSKSYTYGNPKIIYQIRMGSTNSTNQKFGLDNILIYTTPNNNISAPSGGILAMKVGAENAKFNNDQIELVNVPLLINGEIYCPVDVIERFSGNECDQKYIVILDNGEYIHIENVQTALGVSAKSYDMGLILVGNHDSYIDSNSSYADIADLMKTFIFDLPDEQQLINDVAANTNNFDHPYLLVNGDRFSELRSIYNRGASGKITNAEELVLYNYIQSYIDSAKSTYKTYCGVEVTATYDGITSNKIPVNNNYTKYKNNGYDNGGRVSIDTKPLIYFAFAYQITGNMNYARAAYDFMLYLGKWNHWGPDHFLNCADTAYPFAIAYDWLYDAFVELNTYGEKSKCDQSVYDKSKLATILFTHVIIPGYVQSNNLTCPWPGSANSRYSTKTSNWNAVCTSGVVMAALMLLNEDVSTAGMVFETQKKNSSTSFTQTTTRIEEIGKASIHVGLNTYSDYAAKLTAMNLGTLAQYGLDQYYPDGSYIESPSYWSYGTNSLFRLRASLLSATGDDYGFMDAWGIDTTCYFAVHSESSDYKMWNFNDGSDGKQDSSLFFFVGNYYEDDNLVRVRKKQLNQGKTYTIYDILFYDASITGEPELSTEYLMLGIDAYSVRSSWDKGSIDAGIIGGPNSVSHGQLDAGTFIYHNKGKVWFSDLGTDNYNMAGGYFSNFKLYRVGGEGHNMLLITSEQSSLPYGQDKSADPKITETYSGPSGGYAVLDMSDAYSSHVVSGQRGMLFTNSRSTVVIQDEYVFNGSKTVYWLGHYQLATGYVDDVIVSADGRTAFMISGSDIMRVSIVSDNENLKFEILDAYTYLLDTTKRTDQNKMDQADTEYNRDIIKKLAIKCENVTELNLAVVIEEVSAYETGSSYEYVKMSEWGLQSEENSIIQNNFKADFEKNTSSVGSYQLNDGNGNLSVGYQNLSNSYYFGILSKGSATATGGAFKLVFNDNTPLKLSTLRYVAFDADIFTDSSFIDGTTLGINVKMSDGSTKFVSLASLLDNKIKVGSASFAVQNSFVHLTLIIDTSNGCCYVYVNDTYLAKLTGIIGNDCVDVLSFEFKLPATSEPSAIYIDNLNVRSFVNGYDDTVLGSLTSSNTSLNSWNDRIVYASVSVPLAIANGNTLYTNSQIESAIRSGYDVTLLRNTSGLVNVENGVSVNTNGYDFKYTSSDYICRRNGNYLIFETGSITVTWHVGTSTYKETYVASKAATFKNQSSMVGKTTYTKTETGNGVVYEFFTTGWAKTATGTPLSSSEMIVSEYNCEFWLVNSVPIECLFATIDRYGNVTTYNNESELRSYISNSGNYDIVLCSDVELLANTLTLATSGKKLYLNGHTISHKQNDAHLFLYNRSATANFYFIGPGTIEAENTRTIFTTSSSDADKTSNYGVVAEYVNFVTNGQLADLRIGQHKFIGCSINQVDTTKILIALWNKNPNTLSNGNPENLLTITFDGSTINAPLGVISYSAGTYSEVYVIDTFISVGGYLFESGTASLKFNVSGESSIIASKFASDTSKTYKNLSFNTGTVTNLEIPKQYLDILTGKAVLTNNYDTALPYRVSDNYANVTWKDASGNVLVTEKVAVGVTPKLTNPKVVEYLKNNGSAYTYNLSVISSTTDLVLTPVFKNSIPVLMSMTIENDLTMYLYVAKSEMDIINKVAVDGIVVMIGSYELAEVDGVEYYRYGILNFKPSEASNRIDIMIEYQTGKIVNMTTSAIDYLEELLAVSVKDYEKTLIVKLLKSVHSAQQYFGSTSQFEQDRILGIVEEYKEYDLIFGNIKKEDATTGIFRDIIRSANFNLSASLRIKFYLNPEYTGEFTVTLNGITTKYKVIDGTVLGKDYVEVVLSASEINDTIILSDGTNTLNYGLNAYYAATNNTDYKLNNLLSCMSEYSSAAKVYVDKNK